MDPIFLFRTPARALALALTGFTAFMTAPGAAEAGEYARRGAHMAPPSIVHYDGRTYQRAASGAYEVEIDRSAAEFGVSGCELQNCRVMKRVRPVCERGELVNGVCEVVVDRRLVCPPTFTLSNGACVCEHDKLLRNGRCVDIAGGEDRDRQVAERDRPDRPGRPGKPGKGHGGFGGGNGAGGGKGGNGAAGGGYGGDKGGHGGYGGGNGHGGGKGGNGNAGGGWGGDRGGNGGGGNGGGGNGGGGNGGGGNGGGGNGGGGNGGGGNGNGGGGGNGNAGASW